MVRTPAAATHDPDPDVPAQRRRPTRRRPETLEKPISNVVILVHGTTRRSGTARRPPLRTLLELCLQARRLDRALPRLPGDEGDRAECTAFYEFIYPTFAPPTAPRGRRGGASGRHVAKALRVGALNDGYQIMACARPRCPGTCTWGRTPWAAWWRGPACANWNRRSQAGSATGHLGTRTMAPLVTRATSSVGVHGKRRPPARGQLVPVLSLGDRREQPPGTGLFEWILDQGVQLDTPGTVTSLG
jgi:hypothetical protein